VKLRTLNKEPHRTKKACFFCRTGFEDADAYRNTIQPFDLMSRRHPLPSIRAFWTETRFTETRLMKQIAPSALMTCRHQPAGFASQA
jgi:hypothetical protein